MKTILITDTLFILPEHEEMLKSAGYQIERLAKPDATEDELIEAIKGKHGYILGGIEKVTDKVIDAADVLEAISFTGSDWKYFIPGYEKAMQRGIKISNAPGANSFAVAEYTLALILSMTREMFDLGCTGLTKFKTTNSLEGSRVGIVGLGHIGEKVARLLKSFNVGKIYYFSRTRKPELEAELGLIYSPLEEMLSLIDIVTLHTPKHSGTYFKKEHLHLLKDNSLIVNASFPTAIEIDALYEELQTKRLRAAYDGISDERFNNLPLSVWFSSNEGTAYNTYLANKKGSEMATQSILHLLAGEADQYQVK